MAADKVQNSLVIMSRLIFVVTVLVMVVIVLGRVIVLKVSDQEEYRKNASSIIDEKVEGVRGDIISADGRILATSMPKYELYWDFSVSYLKKNSFFEKNIDSLAKCMSKLFGDSSAESYARTYRAMYKAEKQYYLVRKDVTRAQLRQLRHFPIFDKGRYKSGLITKNPTKRTMPHGELARRTIGFMNINGAQAGLEESYNAKLSGTQGVQRKIKIGSGEFIPIDYVGNVEPRDGCDIVTTIDVGIQDIADQSLKRMLQRCNAQVATAVVMEVKTGKIRAMVNYAYDTTAKVYRETQNFAVEGRVPPGSTYKLASMIAILEETDMDIDDVIQVPKEYLLPGGRTISDDHGDEEPPDHYTVREIMEKSSNIGVATLVRKAYPTLEAEKQFTSRLAKMNLDRLTGIDLQDEASPIFRYAGDANWAPKSSLEMVSIGYETEYAPLQILTLYNAVANNGTMVRPRLLEAVKFHGEVIERAQTVVINSSICNQQTLSKVQEMLRGVVDSGTASNIRNNNLPMAGKTGTAQLIVKGMKSGHSASFAGYFPADNPKYSCIVVIKSPKNYSVYGRSLAAPVFRDIAEKLFAMDRDLHSDIDFNLASLPDRKQLPDSKDGSWEVLDRLFSDFNIPVGNAEKAQSHYVSTVNQNGVVMLDVVPTLKAVVPNVVGMGLRDAMFLLRQKKLVVTVVGRGVVKKQSLPAETEIKGGEKITIELANN